MIIDIKNYCENSQVIKCDLQTQCNPHHILEMLQYLIPNNTRDSNSILIFKKGPKSYSGQKDSSTSGNDKTRHPGVKL